MLTLLSTTQVLGSPCLTCPDPKPNLLFILLDDISADRFPFTGNTYLEGKLPNLEKLLKEDGAIEYTQHYSYASLCGPAQAAFNMGSFASDFGAQHFFEAPEIGQYYAVPPEPTATTFIEEMRKEYYTTGFGKLDYQVSGAPLASYFDYADNGNFQDTTQLDKLAKLYNIPGNTTSCYPPWFSVFNMMDMHEFPVENGVAPIEIDHPRNTELPFGPFGYAPNAWAKMVGKLTNGTVITEPTPENDVSWDYWNSRRVEYLGTCDVSEITKVEGKPRTMPSYFVEDLPGGKITLCHEYDMIRNFDFRLGVLMDKLKADGMYDDTIIMLVGDHGSGFAGAKSYMNPASLHSPMWIKYHKGHTDAPTVQSNGQYKVDHSIVNIYDVFPTMWSVLNKPLLPQMKGKPFAGAKHDTWQYAYAAQGRAGEFYNKNTLVTDGNYVYKRYYRRTPPRETLEGVRYSIANGLQEVAQSINRGEITPGSLLSKYLAYYDVNEPPQEYFGLIGEGVLFDDGNLLYDTTYTLGPVGLADAFDIAVTGTHTPKALDAELQPIYDRMKAFEQDMSSNSAYFGALVQQTKEDIVAEEKAMVTKMLGGLPVDGVSQRAATAPEFFPVPDENGVIHTNVTGVVVQARGGVGAQITSAIVDDLSEVFAEGKPRPIAGVIGFRVPGFDPVDYVSMNTPTVKRRGYLWAYAEGRNAYASVPWGKVQSASECAPRLFLSEDFTFMDVGFGYMINPQTMAPEPDADGCAGRSMNSYDTRDKAWDGSTWVGVDSATGAWIDPNPPQLVDESGHFIESNFPTYTFDGSTSAPKYWAYDAPTTGEPTSMPRPIDPNKVSTNLITLAAGNPVKFAANLASIDEDGMTQGSFVVPFVGAIQGGAVKFTATIEFDTFFAPVTQLKDSQVIYGEKYVVAQASELGKTDSSVSLVKVVAPDGAPSSASCSLATSAAVIRASHKTCCGQGSDCLVSIDASDMAFV